MARASAALAAGSRIPGVVHGMRGAGKRRARLNITAWDAWCSRVAGCLLELAQHLVFGAVDYARGMGLEPHPDFAKCAHILGEWSGSSDIAFGRDGVPMYMQGPHDDTFAILATLRKTVGDGNFHYMARIG
jgi:hypothetical protein